MNESTGQMTGGITTLIVGVAVAVLVLIFVGTLGGQTYELTEDTLNNVGDGLSVTANDTFTVNNVTAVSLSNSDITSGTLVIKNITTTIGNGNFTIDYEAGTVLYLYGSLNGSPLNASYNHANTTIRNSVRRGVISSFGALENTGDYLPIIVLAVIIAMVLGMVITLGKGKFDGGNAL